MYPEGHTICISDGGVECDAYAGMGFRLQLREGDIFLNRSFQHLEKNLTSDGIFRI